MVSQGIDALCAAFAGIDLCDAAENRNGCCCDCPFDCELYDVAAYSAKLEDAVLFYTRTD